MEKPVKREYFHIFLLIIVICICYANSLEAEWHFDDTQNIVNNTHIKITELSWEQLRGTFDSPMSRPVAYLTFGLNYYFSGLDTTGYHLVNIAVHIICAVFAYLVFVRTLYIHAHAGSDTGTDSGFSPQDIALLAAVMWAIHPIQTQAVTYIVQRMASMGAMFYMISLYCYLRARTSAAGSKAVRFIIPGVLCWIAGVLTKENVIVLPLAIIAFEIIFFRKTLQGHKKTILLLSAGFALAVTAALMKTNIGIADLFSYEQRSFTMWQRLITEPIILSRYLFLLLYPGFHFLTLDSGISASQGLLEPPVTLLAALFILSLLAAACLYSRRFPVFSFAVLFYFINHLVESTILPLELYFEHRNYLPSIFIYFAVSFYLLRFLSYIRQHGMVIMQGAVVIVVTLFIISEGWATYSRNSLWQSGIRLWQYEVRKNPGKARPHNNLGLQYGEKGRFQEAIAEFQTAVRLDPDFIEAHYNLGVIYFKQGRYEEALKQFRRDVEYRPDHAVAYSNIGVIYSKFGKMEEAVNAYEKALAIDPDSVEALANLGILYARQGNFAAAVRQLQAALKINPDSAAIHFNLGNVYLSQGNYREAARHLHISLSLKPDYREARNLLNRIESR